MNLFARGIEMSSFHAAECRLPCDALCRLTAFFITYLHDDNALRIICALSFTLVVEFYILSKEKQTTIGGELFTPDCLYHVKIPQLGCRRKAHCRGANVVLCGS